MACMTRRELHCYDYVNQPYEAVRTTLLADPLGLFTRATSPSGVSAGAELHVTLGALDVAAEVAIAVRDVVETRAHDRAVTQIDFSWRAVRHPGLFPTMTACLRCYELSPTETQLEITGSYEPPLGITGQAVDAIAMHRVAETSVANFVRDVASFLRRTMQDAQVVREARA
jgi:hypothetical protein